MLRKWRRQLFLKVLVDGKTIGEAGECFAFILEKLGRKVELGILKDYVVNNVKLEKKKGRFLIWPAMLTFQIVPGTNSTADLLEIEFALRDIRDDYKLVNLAIKSAA